MSERKEPLSIGSAQYEQLDLVDRISIVIYFILMFLAMTVSTGKMSIILIAGALSLTLIYALLIRKRGLSALRHTLSVPAVGLLGFALMNGMAAIYSDFGGYAVGEFNKFLAAFAITAPLLFCFQKKYTNGVVWGFSSVSAVIGMLGVDAACKGPLFGVFQKLMLLFGSDYSFITKEIGFRLDGIYNDSNVTASLLALGCLLSLYLMIKENILWKRLLASLLLGCSVMSFFMSVSRGATVCFAIALLVWLAVAGKGNRIRLLLLMIFSAGTTILLSSMTTPLFGGESLMPSLLTLVCGPVIFLLDFLIGNRLANVLAKHVKVAIIAMAGLILSCLVFAIAAITVSGPYTLSAGQWWVRNVNLEPGEYTVSGDWDGVPSVVVYANSEKDTLTGQYNCIYSSTLFDAVLSIPEDAANILVYLYSDEDIELREITFSNGTKLHLDYPLLPDSIAERLQDGLLSGQNFLQRIQYNKDALVLWKQSPLIGHGLGSTEGLLTSVQPYFYQSLYAHNHVLQVLCDMGLLGGVFFLTMILGTAWLLIRQLRQERALLPGMLLACWVMINTHSLMEINFSIRGYQCFVFPLLMFTAALYTPPIPKKLMKAAGITGAVCIWLFMAVFGGLMESCRMVQREADKFSTTDAYVFMKKMESFIRRDVFDQEQMKLNYVANALYLQEPAFQQNMVKYLEDLRASGTYTACSGLARYYYLPQGDLDSLFACSREGIAQEASTKEAWNLQFNFYRNDVLQIVNSDNYDQFITGVLGTKTYYEEYSANHWEEITLEEENQKFLNLVQSLHDEGIDSIAGVGILSTLSGENAN